MSQVGVRLSRSRASLPVAPRSLIGKLAIDRQCFLRRANPPLDRLDQTCSPGAYLCPGKVSIMAKQIIYKPSKACINNCAINGLAVIGLGRAR